MLGHHDHDRYDHDRDGSHHGSHLWQGREHSGTFWRDFFAAVPDAEVVLEGLAVDGDEVLGRLLVRGTHTGDSLGFPGTGRALSLREVDVWQISDRILAGRWDELRETALFHQLGQH